MSKNEEPKITNELDNAITAIEKQFGKGTITRLNENTMVDIECVSSGNLQLDKALGKGIPRGRIIEVYGAYSSGKSTLMYSIIKSFQDLGETVAYLDAEHALDKNYAELNGVNINTLLFSQPEYTEQGLEIIERLVESGKVGLIVLDSIAALPPKAELEGEAGDSHMGLQARLMSQAFRRMVGKVDKSKTTVVIINQIRKNIGVMFGSPNTTTSGEALKFYSSIRIELSRISTNKKGDDIISTTIKAKVVKNKVAPPYKESTFDIYFDSGMCRVSDIIAVALERGILVKKGAWYSFQEENIAQGLENLRDLLKNDANLLDTIKSEIFK